MKLQPWVGAHRKGELGGGGGINSDAGSGPLAARVDKWHWWSGGCCSVLRDGVELEFAHE
jgi:hypothetical protein